MKFQPKAKPSKSEAVDEKIIITIHRNTDPEFFDKVRMTYRKAGLTGAEFGRQCIAYALENMEEE